MWNPIRNWRRSTTGLEVLGVRAGIGLRVNPDVDPQTHPHISTGLKENKFGIDIEGSLAAYRRAAALKHLDIKGVSCHIGSQVTKISPFIDALGRLKELIRRLRKEGIAIRYLDLGGGLGITYDQETPPPPVGICPGDHRCGAGRWTAPLSSNRVG